MSDQCDISCLSPDGNKKIDDDCSNFESASFMSVGKEQLSIFRNGKYMVDKIKSMSKKAINFS